MKRVLVCIMLISALFLCGCGEKKEVAEEKVSYTTKYIKEYTQLKEEPSESAKSIYPLVNGEEVSFEKFVEGGFAKVVHNGVAGYVSSACLSDKKEEEKKPYVSKVPVEIPETEPELEDDGYYGDYSYLIAYESASSIESYVSTYVRPIYNKITQNESYYKRDITGNITSFYNENGIVRMDVPQGTDDFNLTRKYYFDSNGDLIFAFVYNGSQEHRLYFKEDKLVRYIDEDGNTFNNPDQGKGLIIADRALREAY